MSAFLCGACVALCLSFMERDATGWAVVNGILAMFFGICWLGQIA